MYTNIFIGDFGGATPPPPFTDRFRKNAFETTPRNCEAVDIVLCRKECAVCLDFLDLTNNKYLTNILQIINISVFAERNVRSVWTSWI